MDIKLNEKAAADYSSASQKVRVLTEAWVSSEAFCPACGKFLKHIENNAPVEDFRCLGCSEGFELKAKKDSMGKMITDGAYRTMIERLNSSTNPNLFLLNYNHDYKQVINFLVIPKYFFIPEMIVKRKPLAKTARRAGWVGCNISIENIPDAGKIFYIKGSVIEPKQKIIAEWQKTNFLKDKTDLTNRGWIVDIMYCIDGLRKKDFTLADVYKCEKYLEARHPNNKHIKDKIRQQLQILRDKGYLDFVSKGLYRLI